MRLGNDQVQHRQDLRSAGASRAPSSPTAATPPTSSGNIFAARSLRQGGQGARERGDRTSEAAGRAHRQRRTNSDKTWELHDWRTGEALAGSGDPEEMGKVGERPDPDGTWDLGCSRQKRFQLIESFDRNGPGLNVYLSDRRSSPPALGRWIYKRRLADAEPLCVGE